jgi:hypothetical protein
MTRIIRCLLIFILFAVNIQAQDIVSPLNIPLLLSGNFGELRHNHFHSGIDFKTQGKTGFAVKSVKQGYITRISVGPYGYGRAVYINHPDGTTSVYGHLDHFASKIESAVRDSQYLKESFAVNLFFAPDAFPLQQGEVFAYSGNTGGSGGPHLHFEFRETESEKVIDPLPYFRNLIKDQRPPEIRGISLYPQVGKGLVNGKSTNQTIALNKDKAGKLSVEKNIVAWGEIGIGIKAYDRMDETSNIYGVKEIILKVDGKEQYHSVLDGLFFDDTRYINTYIDWKEWIENNSFYMKSFVEPENHLGVNRSLSNGIVRIDEEKPYRFEYILKDAFGNTTGITFNVMGEKKPFSAFPNAEVCFRCNKDNEYRGKGIALTIPQKNLYTDLYLNVNVVSSGSPFAPLYVIGERIPLHTYCPLTLDIPRDTFPDKSKYGIVQIYKKKRTWIGGDYQKGKISGKIRELGSYTVQIDTVPPTIVPVNQPQWAVNKRITFKITDDLSGIASYRGSIDGKFALFEYDVKSQSLFYVYDSQRMKKTNFTVEVLVIDEAGNRSELRSTFVPSANPTP